MSEPESKKPARLWVYLNEDGQNRLNRLRKKIVTLGDVEILTTIAEAGLKACEDEGLKLPLPLTLKIVPTRDDDPRNAESIIEGMHLPKLSEKTKERLVFYFDELRGYGLPDNEIINLFGDLHWDAVSNERFILNETPPPYGKKKK